MSQTRVAELLKERDRNRRCGLCEDTRLEPLTAVTIRCRACAAIGCVVWQEGGLATVWTRSF